MKEMTSKQRLYAIFLTVKPYKSDIVRFYTENLERELERSNAVSEFDFEGFVEETEGHRWAKETDKSEMVKLYAENLKRTAEANKTATELDFVKKELKRIGKLYDDADLTAVADTELKTKVGFYIEYLKERLTAEPEQCTTISNEQSERPQRIFVDCLHHEDKEVLMAKLHELLDGSNSGREVAKVLEALQNKNYLIKLSYTTTMVIDTFNLNCSKQSISKFLGRGLIPSDEIQQIIEILP